MKVFTINEQLTACLKHCQRNSYEIKSIQITADTVYYFVINPWLALNDNEMYLTIHSIIENRK